MTPRKPCIRPEDAQSMLREATPGPWELERIDGFLDVVLPTGNGAPEECDLPLIAAAPELAEQIANLRYEYAVELKHGDGWITSRHHTPTIETAKEIAARYKRTDTRIVRRLVSEPEVVE